MDTKNILIRVYLENSFLQMPPSLDTLLKSLRDGESIPGVVCDRILATSIVRLLKKDENISWESVTAGEIPDIILLNPAKSKKSESVSIKIEDVRTFQMKLSLRPTDVQICLITHIDRITVQAANGLLKTLEEIPAYRIFIATTENPRILLPTIRSRMVLMTSDTQSYETLDASVMEAIKNWKPDHMSDLIAISYMTKWEKENALTFLREISRVILSRYPNPGAAYAIAQSLRILHQTNTQPKIAIDRVILALT